MAYLELFTERGLIRRKWRWRRKANNHKTIATSGESFASKWSAERSARREYPDDEIRVESP